MPVPYQFCPYDRFIRTVMPDPYQFCPYGRFIRTDYA
jgi:hypothetical protein